MIRRLVPKRAKAWLKMKIQNVAIDGDAPTLALKYRPYKYRSESFLIPKSPELNYEKCSLGLAIPPKELWLGYGDTKEEYLSGGEEHVQKMLELVRDSDFSFAEEGRILDFGCGAGRMIRFLKNISESYEIWGTDISAEHIYWCKQYLSPPFHFATTTTIPHLPFEDRYFDFIYAGLVFTHIDDLAEAWLLELRRILASNGRLFVTIHDDHTVRLLDGVYKECPLAKMMRTHNLYNSSKGTTGMLVVGRDTGSQVFYDIDYFLRTLRPMYHIHSVTQEGHGYQTAVLLERK